MYLDWNEIPNTVTEKGANEYYTTLLNTKYVICPEGNGIDTHRVVEAWFCGCIPIVEDNPLIRLKYEGLPVLYTKDYSEITNEYLESLDIYKSFDEYDFKKLFINSYPEETQKIIVARCNHWLYKRKGVLLRDVLDKITV